MNTPQTVDSPPSILHKNLIDQQLERRALDINNLYQKLISFNYKSQLANIQNSLETDAGKFFDELIWAQKNYPNLIQQLFQINALQKINEIHATNNMHLLFKNYIILITNSKQHGLLLQLILQHKIPRNVIRLLLQNCHDETDQIIQYIGSFLKMYQRMFHPKWLHKFIEQDDYFQLLQITFKFYNCPEPITRTSVLNSVFAIISYKQVRQFLATTQKRSHFYHYITNQLTKQFRQELAQFCLRLSHTSKNDDVQFIMNQLEDKIAFWQDIANSMEGCQHIFHRAFTRNIILPLLVGPLHYQTHPLFTLKFSLYIIKKLCPIIYKLGLMQPLIKIMLIEQKILFWPSTLQKGILYPFKIDKLLQKKLPTEQQDSCFKDQDEEMQQSENIGLKIRQFYINIFKSKDNHFIQMSSALLLTIITILRQNNQIDILRECKLDQYGKILNLINQILITQLQQPHRLNTIITIVDTLVVINQKNMDNLLQNQYLFILRKIINNNLQIINQHIKYAQHLAEMAQLDIRCVDAIKFGKYQSDHKFQETYKLVFTWDLEKQQILQQKFYTCIPDTNQESARYSFVKFMILRKGAQYLFDDFELGSVKASYYQKIYLKSPFIPGDTYQMHQLKIGATQCEIYDKKNKIPVLIFKDDHFLVIGYFDKQKKSVRIMTSLKFKHLQIESFPKKQKICLKIFVNAYNTQTQRIDHKQPIQIRNCNKIIPYLAACLKLSKQKQIDFLIGLLKQTQLQLPQGFSLI